jgi:tetratricopeptide (TPR) repeat protein
MLAVVPFHVVGDTALLYLREGMVDLLAAKLSGVGAPHVADPQSVMRAWKKAVGSDTADLSDEAAVRLAERLGAADALVGDVVGTHERLIFSASLLEVPGGRSRGAATVSGPLDSLPRLIDRLTALVLARFGGEDEPDLAAVTSTSLSALRSYLAAKSAYRGGRYEEAAGLFRQGLLEDSTFALAALGLAYATGWSGLSPQTLPAWSLRDRMSTTDRIVLTAFVGPHFPAPSSERDFLTTWEAAAVAAPAQPEVWYNLGDALYHAGGILGEDPSQTRMRAAFRRAVELDSGFAGPLAHLVELAARAHDTGDVRRLGTLYLSVDSGGDLADYLRWRVATALGDDSALNSIRRAMTTMGGEALRRIVMATQLDGLALGDGMLAAQVWGRTGDPRPERFLRLVRLHDFALNRGAPEEALHWTDSMRALWPRSHAPLRLRIADGLYGEGDLAAARNAADELISGAEAPSPGDPLGRAEHYADLCSVARWRLAQGDAGFASRAVKQLLGSSRSLDSTDVSIHDHWCAIVLQALQLSARHPTTGDSVEWRALDSLMRSGPRPLEILQRNGFFRSFAYAGLLVSHLREARGDLAGALDAVRRRPYQAAGTTYLASYLLHEGRLAAMAGDRQGAIRAYQHYLILRPHAEPSVVPEVRRVEGEVARLLAE